MIEKNVDKEVVINSLTKDMTEMVSNAVAKNINKETMRKSMVTIANEMKEPIIEVITTVFTFRNTLNFITAVYERSRFFS